MTAALIGMMYESNRRTEHEDASTVSAASKLKPVAVVHARPCPIPCGSQDEPVVWGIRNRPPQHANAPRLHVEGLLLHAPKARCASRTSFHMRPTPVHVWTPPAHMFPGPFDMRRGPVRMLPRPRGMFPDPPPTFPNPVHT